jgi:hypothetical protein
VIEPEPPTNISEQGGTLNVQINPEGSETGYEIRMECEAPSVSELTGCDPELFPGERLRAGQLVASFTDQTVSVTLTGLQPGYVYMYVIFATNAGGATERGANILQTYPPGAYSEGSPGKQYEPGPPSQASLEFAQQEADRLTAKAEAERQQQAREHEEQKARETAAVYAAEVAALKRREEEAAAAKTGGDVVPVCVVPALTGDTLNAARQAIEEAHCRLGEIREPHHRHRGMLTVLGQSQRHGMKLAGGTVIAVTMGAARSRHHRG